MKIKTTVQNAAARVRNFIRAQKPRTFSEKFGRDAAFFGSREPHTVTKPRVGWLVKLVAGSVGIICVCVCTFLLSELWRVDTVTSKDGSYYTADTLIRLSGVEAGDAMLSFDASDVSERLREALPLLKTVKVRRHLNGELEICVTDEEKVYYTCYHRNYYLISAESLRVLGVFASPDEARRVGALYIGLPEEAYVRVGEKLTYRYLPYAPESVPEEQATYELETDEPKEEYAYVFEFVSAVESAFGGRVSGMETADRYDLWIVLDGRVQVCLGTMDELDRKLQLANRVLSENGGTGDLPARLDVSDPQRSTYREGLQIELPDWATASQD